MATLSTINVAVIHYTSQPKATTPINALVVDGRLTTSPDQAKAKAFLKLLSNSGDFTPARKGNTVTWVRNGHTARAEVVRVPRRSKYERKQFTETDNKGVYVDQDGATYIKVGNGFIPTTV